MPVQLKKFDSAWHKFCDFGSLVSLAFIVGLSYFGVAKNEGDDRRAACWITELCSYALYFQLLKAFPKFVAGICGKGYQCSKEKIVEALRIFMPIVSFLVITIRKAEDPYADLNTCFTQGTITFLLSASLLAVDNLCFSDRKALDIKQQVESKVGQTETTQLVGKTDKEENDDDIQDENYGATATKMLKKDIV